MKTISFTLIAGFLLISPSYALEIAGVDMPDSIAADQSTLNLNGAGVRSKFFLKLYVGGLYLTEEIDNPQNIIDADEPMAIKLHMVSSMITSKKMKKATQEGFAKSTNGNTAQLTDQIQKFIDVFKEEIKEGDIFDLVYSPENGTQIFKNTELHSAIKGLPFKKALFGIWLCDRPAQNSLKQKMLGK